MQPDISLFTRLHACYPASDETEAQAQALYDGWNPGTAFRTTLEKLLAVDDAVIAAFYLRLAQSGSQMESFYPSRFDSACFLNIRSLGRDNPHRYGTMIDALKIIPSLRVQCIHLAPFTVYEHECIYAPASLRTIDSRVTDHFLENAGFSREDQLAVLCGAMTLLGKTAGFDLEPHVTQFAVTVISQPRVFRWIRLDPVTGKLRAPDMKTMLSDSWQESCAGDVDAIRNRIMMQHGCSSLEYTTEEERRIRQPVHHLIISALIDKGLWTIPSQIWSGAGIPEFNYLHPDGYPVFACRDREGIDRRESALNVVTPFRFDRPGTGFDSIFPWFRDRFGFGLVRFDSVDHIFDSCTDFSTPESDRPSPADLAGAVRAARDHHPEILALAERMGTEFEQYASCGFDALLGDDMFSPVDKKLLMKCSELSRELSLFNADAPHPVTVCFAVDTHDTGDPNLLGASLTESLSGEELTLRHFLSRFCGSRGGKRAKYETVGCQDRSYGLFTANVTDANMVYRGDDAQVKRYHLIEDAYEEYLPIIVSGQMKEFDCTDDGASWIIPYGRESLLCALVFPGKGGYTIPGQDVSEPCVCRIFGSHNRVENSLPDALEEGTCLVAKMKHEPE